MVLGWNEAYTEALTDAYCTFMGLGANQYRLLANLVGQSGDVPQRVVDELLGILDNTLRFICGRSVPPPPLVGGECPIPYGIQITYTVEGLNPAQTYTVTQSSDCALGAYIFGPVGAPWNGTDVNGFYTWFIRGFDANGNTKIERITDAVSPSIYRGVIIDSLEFFPCDPNYPGCEPEYRLPDPFDFNLDIGNVSFVYVDIGGQQINVDGRLTLESPSININGRLSIPFTFTLGPNNLNISPTFRGDFSVNFGGGGLPPAPVTNPPPPNRTDYDVDVSVDINGDPPPPVQDPPDIEFYRPRDGQLLYGVIVSASVNPSNGLSVIFQGDNPDIYVPSLGHVNFLQGVGENRAWSEDIKVKNTGQLIIAPDPLRAISVSGTGQPGVSLRLNPVYIDTAQYLGLQSSQSTAS